MKNILLTIAFSALIMFTAAAQDKTVTNDGTTETKKIIDPLSFSVGLDQGIPVGRVSKFSSYVAGASLQAEYLMLKELGITLNTGYLYYVAKDGEKGLPFLPVMGGVRFHITPKLYLSGQAGVSFYLGNENEGGSKSTYLTYAEGIGYQVLKRVDLLLKYEGVNVGAGKDYSFAGMRLAYRLNKRKTQ